MKKCSKCKIEKQISEFIPCERGKYGVRGECKTCKKKYDIKYKKENPDKYRETNKKSFLKRRIKIKKYRRINRVKRNAYLKEWHKRNPDKRKAQKLRHLYNIDLPEYNALLKNQSFCCAICKQRPIKKMLCVDHDHKSKLVRGLLCQRCNSAIGFFRDNILLLEQAKIYLEDI